MLVAPQVQQGYLPLWMHRWALQKCSPWPRARHRQASAGDIQVSPSLRWSPAEPAGASLRGPRCGAEEWAPPRRRPPRRRSPDRPTQRALGTTMLRSDPSRTGQRQQRTRRQQAASVATGARGGVCGIEPGCRAAESGLSCHSMHKEGLTDMNRCPGLALTVWSRMLLPGRAWHGLLLLGWAELIWAGPSTHLSACPPMPAEGETTAQS
mmetsp:Transcript_165544/g.526427  ORF Transcript_165544/g.526427 Transcript_165544/m.526427 type:complete len:209 (-) Transcript_165544:54-680(-)